MSKEQSFWTLVANVGKERFGINDAYADDDMMHLFTGAQIFREKLDKVKGGSKAKIVKEKVTEDLFWKKFAGIEKLGVMSKIK